MKAKIEAVNNAMQAVSSDLYSRARSARGGPGGAPGGGPEGAEPREGPEPEAKGGKGGEGGDSVIDADFEMVDDKDKKKR
jgi:hypothetical protein